ncbi:MAG: phenylalanine 4-monooxygenase [Pseudomonadota bacterium]
MTQNALLPPAGAASDWTIPQRWARYTDAEHAVWDQLYARQMGLLAERAVPDFLSGVVALGMNAPGIPDFELLSTRLQRLTGWSVVAVPGLVPDEVFFEHLANRRFVAGNFIRSAEQLDYLQEPDVFHDVFGHVPLLAHPVYADYMQAYGRGGLRAMRFGAIHKLARLYWHTVEFGLIRDGERLRLFGAGILSSFGESQYALDDPAPPRIAFDLRRVMRTEYVIDHFQSHYFVIDSFEDLLHNTLEVDFGPLYAELEGLPDLQPSAALPSDVLYPAPGSVPLSSALGA